MVNDKKSLHMPNKAAPETGVFNIDLDSAFGREGELITFSIDVTLFSLSTISSRLKNSRNACHNPALGNPI